MDTDIFVFETATEDFYKDIVKDLEKKFDTNGYLKGDINLPIGRNTKITGIMKVKLGGKIMGEFGELRTKMYAHKNLDKKLEDKRYKGTKNGVGAKGFTFDDYKTCIFHGKAMYKEQMLFENEKQKEKIHGK